MGNNIEALGENMKTFILIVMMMNSVFNTCNKGEYCLKQEDCPSFLEEKDRLKNLRKGSIEWRDLVSDLKERVCDKGTRAVCCKCNRGQICLKREDCPKVESLYKEYDRNKDRGILQNLKDLVCDKNDKTFCCDTLGKQIQQYDESNSPTWLPKSGECGLGERAAFIIGGDNAKPGEFPFTAVLGYPYLHKNEWVQFTRSYETWEDTRYKCGGTLINKWYVLTAAHCQGKSKYSQISKVRLGELIFGINPDCLKGSNTCVAEVQDFDITSAQVTVHEDFDRGLKNIVNDVALIKLPRPAVLNKGVQIACLPIDAFKAARDLEVSNLKNGLIGKMLTVVGWGYTDYDPHALKVQGDFKETGVANTALQKLKIPVLSTSVCSRKFQKGFQPEESQICAGGENGKDSCKGDSGGPLYYKTPKDGDSHPWYLLGVVSFGASECGNGSPGIYSRVEHFLPWIKKNLK